MPMFITVEKLNSAHCSGGTHPPEASGNDDNTDDDGDVKDDNSDDVSGAKLVPALARTTWTQPPLLPEKPPLR